MNLFLFATAVFAVKLNVTESAILWTYWTKFSNPSKFFLYSQIDCVDTNDYIFFGCDSLTGELTRLVLEGGDPYLVVFLQRYACARLLETVVTELARCNVVDELSVDSKLFGGLRQLLLIDTSLSGYLPSNVFDVDDTFMLSGSNFERDSLEKISTPPRLPANCTLPKNYFYWSVLLPLKFSCLSDALCICLFPRSPLPPWTVGCQLQPSDCLQRPVPLPFQQYITNGCPSIASDCRGNLAGDEPCEMRFACSLVDSSPSQLNSADVFAGELDFNRNFTAIQVIGHPNCYPASNSRRAFRPANSDGSKEQYLVLTFNNSDSATKFRALRLYGSGTMSNVSILAFESSRNLWTEIGQLWR
jgi:hypothetical protein